MRIYSIFDSKAGAYLTPFFHRNNATAMRDMEQGVNDPSTGLHKYPADFALFCLAEWDDVAGTIFVLDHPEPLGSLRQFVKTDLSGPFPVTDPAPGAARLKEVV